jgi:Tol biopolymer transport system component
VCAAGCGGRLTLPPPCALATHANEDSGPSWSPNGRMIAFVRGTGRDLPGGAIFVMKADGTSPLALTTGPKDAPPAWRRAR